MYSINLNVNYIGGKQILGELTPNYVTVVIKLTQETGKAIS